MLIPYPGTYILPVSDHSPEVDRAAKGGISAVDDQTPILSLLPQCVYTKSEDNFRDNQPPRHLHWSG